MTYIYYIHHSAFVASAYQLASNAGPATLYRHIGSVNPAPDHPKAGEANQIANGLYCWASSTTFSGVSPHDVGLYFDAWGFDPRDINVETHLWYGGSATLVPERVGEWLVDQIPNATDTSWPDHGHFTWMEAEAVGVVQQITRT